MLKRAVGPCWPAPLLVAAALAALSLPAAAQDYEAAVRAEDAPPNAMWVESMDLSQMTQDYGSPHRRRSVDENPLTLGGVMYPHGIGTHATSELTIDLKGSATRFVSMAGLDDEKKGQGSVTFEVWVDGKKAAETPTLHGGESRLVSVDVTGAKKLRLLVTDAGDGIDSDHGDWAGALLYLVPGAAQRPTVASAPPEPSIPIATGPASPVPAIHGARVVGTTPGRPFVFLIPTTGQGPLTFSATGLPAGLTLDRQTGIITGSLKSAGAYTVGLAVKGPRGTARRRLTIVGGQHKLAQTPPMGWNSWNVWAGAIDDAKVRAAADWMVKSGLAAHGFQYVNIDDCWEDGRDENGMIRSNAKFPNMKALADYVHSKGLKLGIYSSPGPKTCAGFEASYQHEQKDADQYANWGIDYLKYDWCSYGGIAQGNSLAELQKPYAVMRRALDNCSRDIVYSLCQYGMGNVWTWGAEVGGNCWRTTGDINDSWGSLQGIAFSQNGHEKFAGPGHWNDPDMLIVGKVGWGNPHPTRLKPNEQILHITMWCLQSAPLLIGCDMSQLDQFTLDLLTNDEVLAVNQDPLGKPAGRRSQEGQTEVWARPLWDGTMAVGLFNRGADGADVTARWVDLGLKGRQPVRDLWQRKDLSAADGAFTTRVPAHGAILVRIGRPNKTD